MTYEIRVAENMRCSDREVESEFCGLLFVFFFLSVSVSMMQNVVVCLYYLRFVADVTRDTLIHSVFRVAFYFYFFAMKKHVITSVSQVVFNLPISSQSRCFFSRSSIRTFPAGGESCGFVPSKSNVVGIDGTY